MKLLTFIGALLVLAMAGSTAAQWHRGSAQTPPSFELLDTDQSGQISQVELLTFQDDRRSQRLVTGRMAQQKKAVSFQLLDLDQNGSISRDEFMQHQQITAQQRCNRMKVNCRGNKNQQWQQPL